MSKESCGKGGKNKRGKRGKEPAGVAVGSSLYIMIQMLGIPSCFPPWGSKPQKYIFQLYFMPGLVSNIVQHTNAYAYIKVAKENSTKHCYMESDGCWGDTTPDEILRLIGLLI